MLLTFFDFILCIKDTITQANMYEITIWIISVRMKSGSVNAPNPELIR